MSTKTPKTLLQIVLVCVLAVSIGVAAYHFMVPKNGEPPVAAVSLVVPQPDATRIFINFGETDPRWRFAEGAWEVRKNGETVSLAQVAADREFPVALLEADQYTAVDISVRFRPISGKGDASGGIIFRARDARNYYLVRANALEDNFQLYRVVNGNRIEIASIQTSPPSIGQWHSLRVVAVDDQIQAYLDGRLLIDHRDGTYVAGYIGLWTKGDSVTDFTDMTLLGIRK
ncbi:MAG TPA: family 16 glycoside hydrolase [Symbiobacteriaceae bacterium]